jgi:integrase/recombinase XerD
MTKAACKPLPQLLEYFFTERLQSQRQASGHTLATYRDTFALLLRFIQQQTQRDPCQQRLEDWDAPRILQFLDYLEKQRHCQPRTRNARLAAIRSFMRVAAQQEPLAWAVASRVLAIPMKRFDRPLLGYLSVCEVQAILQAPDPTRWNGRRDRVLLALLYNTGARVSEILALRRRDIQGHSTYLLQLHGKGRKQRTVPLWKCTSLQLKRWLAERPGAPETSLFTNRSGQPLSRFGLGKRLALAVESAALKCPSLKERTISPHTFRHSTAMHLLQAGVDITVIALLLGHESPATTHQYIELDLEMKERCLSKLKAPKATLPRFKPTDQLLEFLENL